MTELTLEELGRRRVELRERLEEVTALIKPLVLAELAASMSEVQVARVSGVDRMTIRKWRKQAAESNNA